MEILQWLSDPVRHFPPQRDGDLVHDGVCGVFISDKLGVSQPTTSRHLGILIDAGLLTSTRKKGWTFYRRNEEGIAAAQEAMRTVLSTNPAGAPSS